MSARQGVVVSDELEHATGQPRPLSDVSAGSWIADRLGPFGGVVGSIVPRGFARYARILHPVQMHDGFTYPDPLRWADACAATGYTAHRDMHWYDVAGATAHPDGHDARWALGRPDQGQLASREAAVLRTLLAAHSGDQDCYFGIWEGYGWTTPPPWATPQALAGAGRMRHPHRDYLVLRAPLAPVLNAGTPNGPAWEQTPNLLWPADRSWCVATEVDFDSTLVGGPVELVSTILADQRLETWAVEQDDDLAWHGAWVR
jgi:hypothetical protein